MEAVVVDADVVGELVDHRDGYLLDQVVEDESPDDPDILGLYEGIALTERENYSGALPDQISLYRIPLCLMAEDLDHLIDEIAITVVHEFAHHVGIDDARLHELGWD